MRRHEGGTTGRYKLIRFYGIDVPDGEEWEFYDLERDKHEVVDIPRRAKKKRPRK